MGSVILFSIFTQQLFLIRENLLDAKGTGRMIFGLICMLQCLIKTNGAFFCFFFYSRLFVYFKKGFSLFYVDFQFCLVKKHAQLMPNLTYVHTNSCLLIKKKFLNER